MGQVMGRATAIQQLKSYISRLPNEKCIHSSKVTKSASKVVYWIEIPVQKIEESSACSDIWLLLHDHPSSTFHVLVVPSEFFEKNLHKLRVRLKKEKEYISLELTLDSFIDVHSSLCFESFAKPVNH
ncbi:MAG: hypothetical protein HQL54_00690 [Magnetococcales bacterium]|nr:hypothetical protein [Magnetococcales bacterium]